MPRILPARGALTEGRDVTFDVRSLLAPGVETIESYQAGKPLSELARECGINDAIKLASNENPLGPSRRAVEAARAALDDIARYPDGRGYALKRALADRLKVSSSQVTLGNGSNDVLELIVRTFAADGDEVIHSQYAFAMYGSFARAVGARPVVAPARQWAHDLAAMRRALTARTRLVFIANPNNPTGTWTAREELEQFLSALAPRVMVVLDEAYFEYVDEPAYPDALSMIARYPNLIVTRTFSKVYGLAGLRVGYGISGPEVAAYLDRVRQPFNVNSVAAAAAEAALADEEHFQQSIDINREGMRQLRDGFERLGLTYIPSVANFLTVDLGRPAGPIHEALLRHGVIVRSVAAYNMPNHLRVTVGLPEENGRFLRTLQAVMLR